MILVDTNVISEFARQAMNPAVEQWMNAQSPGQVCTSAITLAEIRFGLAQLPQGRRRAQMAAAMNAIFAEDLQNQILPFDAAAAEIYSERMAAARRSGRAVADLDGMIGAIALSRGLMIATRDVAPFQALGVAVTNPWETTAP